MSCLVAKVFCDSKNFSYFQLTHEEEEAERRELQKLLSDDKPSKESVSIKYSLVVILHVMILCC